MPLELEPQIEFVPHEHTEDCYTEVQTLTCMEEEHVHDDDCYDPEDGTLICEKFEHTHDENCYTTEYELTWWPGRGRACGAGGRAHPDRRAGGYGCGRACGAGADGGHRGAHLPPPHRRLLRGSAYLPLPEHHHTVACLSDTSADVETPEEWQAANADAVITGKWNEDLLSVAKTQLGYEQSEKTSRSTRRTA